MLLVPELTRYLATRAAFSFGEAIEARRSFVRRLRERREARRC